MKTISVKAKSNILPGRETVPHIFSLEACGMHPYDLVKKMGETTLADIEKTNEKKITAYVTLGWSGSPESVDITTIQKAFAAELAMEKLRKDPGYVIGSNTPTAEQPAYLAESASQRLSGILSFFVPCAVASAAYGGIMHFGVIGAMFDVTLDCALPAVWASRQPLKDSGGVGGSIVKSIEDFARRFIPFLGEWLFPKEVGGSATSPPTGPGTSPPTKEEVTQKAQETKDTITNAAIFGVGTDTILYAVKNGGAVITPYSADLAGKRVAETVFGKLKSTSLKKLAENAATDLTAKTLLEEMQTNYAKKITDNLVLQNTLDPKGARFIDDAIVSASKTATTEFGGEISGNILSHSDLFGGANKSLDDVGKKLVNELIDDDVFVRNSANGLSLELPETTIGATARGNVPQEAINTKITAYTKSVQDAFEENVKSSLRSQMGTDALGVSHFDRLYQTGTPFEAAVNNAITEGKSGIRITAGPVNPGTTPRYRSPTSYKYSAKVTSNMDDIARRTTAALKSGPASKIIIENVDTLGRKAGSEFGEILVKGNAARNLPGLSDDLLGTLADPKAGAGRTSRLGQNLKNWKQYMTGKTGLNLFKNLAKGVAGGVIAYYAGMKGWEWYWEDKVNDQPKGGNRINVNPTTGKPSTTASGSTTNPIKELTGQHLLNSQVLEKGSTYRLEITGDETGKIFTFTKLGNEDFETMKKDIASNKAVLWEEKGCTNFNTKKVDDKALGNLAPTPSKKLTSAHGLAYYRFNSVFAKAGIGDSSTPGDDLPEEDLAAILFIQPDKIPNCGIAAEWYVRAQGESIENAKKRAEEAITCAARELRNAKTSGDFTKAIEKFSSDAKYTAPVVATQALWKTYRIVRA